MTQAPAPPQGPGVFPPFPAPPTEGRGRRVGFGLGIGAVVVLLVCGGGLTAAIGLTQVVNRALNEQAQVVVGAYLDDLEAKRYDDAYRSLCSEARDAESQAEFTSRVATEDPIESYKVGEINAADVDLAVPVDVTYADGRTESLKAFLGQSRETGEFQVCSLE
jgi:hypothetical protein